MKNSKTIRLYPADNYLFKVNDRNTVWNIFKVNNKDTTTPMASSGVFILNFEYISHLDLVFLLLTLKMWLPAG